MSERTDLLNRARIADAEVNVEDKTTGRKYKARTSDEGEFRVPVLASGTYTITIDSPGFRHFVRDDFYVGGSESVRINVMLEVGMLTGELVITDENTKPDIELRPNGVIFRGRAFDLPIPR
jgi:iron complex outermembrane receptor protein